MAVVTELLALLKLDDKSFKTGMKNAKKDADGFGSRMKNAGQNITSFGNKMTLATAPIALGLGIAINSAKNFDKSMANVNAILGITGTEAKDLRADILEFGGASRQGPQAVADAYYSIVSGVQDASTHMAILDAATRTADAGQADLAATTDGLIATMNAYGFAADDAEFVSDVFTKTVGMGVLTMDELASAMPQVTGLASSMGIGIGDLGGQMAFLTTQGFTAANSATFLKSMMTSLLNPTTDVANAISALGYESGQSMVDALGLVGSYEALKEFNGGSFSGLITSQEALQGATALTKEGFDDFNTTFQDTIEGSTDRAKAIQDEEEAWDKLRSKLSEMSITVGTQLTPVLVALIDEAILPAISGVTDWMKENPELTRQLVLMAGAAVLLGPLISVIGTAATVTATLVGTAVGPILAIGLAVLAVVAAVDEFNRVVGSAATAANIALSDEIAEGVVTRQQLDDASFRAIQANQGDLAARLFYSNASDAVQGTATIVEGRAHGGGVGAGQIVRVNEDGGEYWRPDSGGEVIPLGDSRGGGGATINVYQLPGEDGVALAARISDEMMRTGLIRA